jgi:hypothetical protein
MTEVMERQGGSPAEWDNEPWEFVLYSYLHLKEIDRRRAWLDRLHRVEAAQLLRIALSTTPQRLDDEWRNVIAAAAGPPALSDVELRERGVALAFAIQRTKLVEVC